MGQHTISRDELSELVVTNTSGSLYLTGWNRDEIRINDPSDQEKINQKKALLEISFKKDGIVHLPHDLPVIIKSVGGDLVIKNIGSSLQIESVGGDVTLTGIGTSSIKTIGGDVFAKQVQGDLVIDQVGKDSLIDTVKGQLSLHSVGNDIQISDIAGGVDAWAGNDAQVSISPVPWQAYQIEVGGDISLALPEDCNADLTIKSGKGDIRLNLGSIDEKISENEYKWEIGEGGPAITISAGGKVFLSNDIFNWFEGIKVNASELEDLAMNFSSQAAEGIKTLLDHLEDDFRESLVGLSETLESAGLTKENLEKIKNQIEESSKLTIQKAELAAAKAGAKVEKKIAKAKYQANELKKKTSEFDLNAFLTSDADRGEVTDKERLMILEMLQENKISLEEAEGLLNALEGKRKQ